MGKASFRAAACVAAFGAVGGASAETLTIATVNNSDMIIMQKLSPQWEKATGNKLNWVVLEENVLRQRVTTDIATKSGAFEYGMSSEPTPVKLTPACSSKVAISYNSLSMSLHDQKGK